MILYRIVDENPYLDREEEYAGLGLEEAASRMEDLTSVEAATIIADVEEDADHLPWIWVDEETGREVALRLEVS